MNRGEARTMLRLILGDQSNSVWSDTELNTTLSNSNIRICRRVVIQSPDGAHVQILHGLPASVRGDLWLSATDAFEYTPVVTFESVFFTTSLSTLGVAADGFALPGGPSATAGINMDVPWTRLPIRGSREIVEHSNNPLLEPALYGRFGASPYSAYFSREAGVLSVRPRPKVDMVLLLEAVSYTTSPLDNDATSLLLTPLEHVHEAVVFDAAYILSMKDQGLRQEFAAERERILNESAVTATTHAQAD